MVRRLLSRLHRALTNIVQTGSPRLTQAAQADRWIKPNIERYQWLYDRLDDDESRTLLVKLLAYRALGHRYIKLPLNTPEYWEMR